MKVYLCIFKDNDTGYEYHLLTTEDKFDLISNIEQHYYDFEMFEYIDDLLDHLEYNKVSQELLCYISSKEYVSDLIDKGIFCFTVDVLKNLNVLVDFESKTFTY